MAARFEHNGSFQVDSMATEQAVGQAAGEAAGQPQADSIVAGEAAGHPRADSIAAGKAAGHPRADSMAAGKAAGQSRVISARIRTAVSDERAVPAPEASDSVVTAEPQLLYDPAGLIGAYDPTGTIPRGTDPAETGPVAAEAAPGPLPWRDTTARAVFGDASTLVEPNFPTPLRSAAPTDNAPLQAFVLVLAAVYAIFAFRNFNDIATLLNRIFHDASPGKRLTEEFGNSGFSHVLRMSNFIGLLAIGLPAVKFGEALIPHLPDGLLADCIGLILAFAASIAAGVIILYQRIILHSTAAITVSQPFIANILQLKRTCFALTALFTLPVILLLVLANPDTAKYWGYLFIALSALAIILYLKESLALFLSKNLSILHWFLYLCTVDIFPLSLFWLLITREYETL